MPNEIELFDFSFDDDLPIDILIKIARENIHKLASSNIESFGSRLTTSFFSVRQEITKLFLLLRCNYNELR